MQVMNNFNVLARISLKEVPVYDELYTKHVLERIERIDKYYPLMSNKMLYAFLVDTQHPAGTEIHAINENGLIYIFSNTTRRLITIIHPRRAQILRYFEGFRVPKRINVLIENLVERNDTEQLNNI